MTENIACPTGCSSDNSLPPVLFDFCAPDWRKSEITTLLLGKADSTAFTDWEELSEWTTRLSQSATTADKIRTLTVRANKPATTKQTIELTKGRVIQTNRHHVINFTVDEMGDLNYDFFRVTQCGAIAFRVWYVNNAGKDIYGGNTGIRATLFGEPIYDEGSGAIQRFVGTLEWDALQDPWRAVNPIAGL